MKGIERVYLGILHQNRLESVDLINFICNSSKRTHENGGDLQIHVWKPHGCMNSTVSFRYIGRYPDDIELDFASLISVYSLMSKHPKMSQGIINFFKQF